MGIYSEFITFFTLITFARYLPVAPALPVTSETCPLHLEYSNFLQEQGKDLFRFRQRYLFDLWHKVVPNLSYSFWEFRILESILDKTDCFEVSRLLIFVRFWLDAPILESSVSRVFFCLSISVTSRSPLACKFCNALIITDKLDPKFSWNYVGIRWSWFSGCEGGNISKSSEYVAGSVFASAPPTKSSKNAENINDDAVHDTDSCKSMHRRQ